MEDERVDVIEAVDGVMPRKPEEMEQLGRLDAAKYVSVGALLNYIAPDRADIQWAVKEVLRRSSAPSKADETRIKRICRYLRGRPRVVIRFGWQAMPSGITTLVDSDFAGCPRTRKSCCGGAAMWGQHCLKTWAKTMPVIALSSGEAELGAVVRGATESLGLKSIVADFLWDVTLTIRSDATAAIGIVARLGLGKVRHLAVNDLWIQQRIRDGSIYCEKVWGKANPADALTKPLDGPALERQMAMIGMMLREGRATSAPRPRPTGADAGV